MNKSVSQFEPQEIEPQIILTSRFHVNFTEVPSDAVHTVNMKYKWIG